MSDHDDLPKRGRGRPRNGDTAENAHRRKVEALRLEAERDAAAERAEREGTVSARTAHYAVEQRLAAAWAASLRSEGRIEAALKYSDAAVKWAAALAKATDQGIADEVRALAARLDKRERAERAASGS